jgi:hypothetical protein
MDVEKNSIGVDFGNGSVYSGDLYKCNFCRKTIIFASDIATNDKDHDSFKEYVKMNELAKKKIKFCFKENVYKRLN